MHGRTRRVLRQRAVAVDQLEPADLGRHTEEAGDGARPRALAHVADRPAARLSRARRGPRRKNRQLALDGRAVASRVAAGRKRPPMTDSPVSNAAQAASSAYRLASLDQEFLLGDSTRGVRFQLEYQKEIGRAH